MSDRDDEWISQTEARQLLGLGKATVPKLVARGLLHPRQQRPSLARSEVLALRDARAEAARRRSLPKPGREPRAEPRPPDDEQPWVRADVVSAFLGVQSAAVRQRTRRGRLPHVVGPDGVVWYQLAQVEATVRAQALSKSRRVGALRATSASEPAAAAAAEAVPDVPPKVTWG